MSGSWMGRTTWRSGGCSLIKHLSFILRKTIAADGIMIFFFLRSSPMRCKNFFPKWMKIRLNGKQRLSGRRGWVRPSLTKDDDGRKPLEGVNCSKHECNWKSFEFSSPIRMLDFFFVFRSSSVALSSSLRRWEWTQTLDTPSQLLSKLFFHA